MNIEALIDLLHHGQMRKTGEPYTSHLYAVRDILIQEGISDKAILASALLHDALEDSDITREYLALWFGNQVAGIVDTVSKCSYWHTSFCKMKSNLHEMQSAWIKYPEAILIKMADRLHNLRTIQGLPPHKWPLYLEETKVYLLPLFSQIMNNRLIQCLSFFMAMKSLLLKIQEETSKIEIILNHQIPCLK
ncbi:MAG: HD domain-containing protein [Candidatus Brocadiae bacterium]|nr:HD domain-containing protein [Candidatus Brocadiia bacterium]